MSSTTPTVLSQADWLAIDQLNDLLAASKEIRLALSDSLELILKSFGRLRGALFIPGIEIGLSGEWVGHGLPLQWDTQLANPNSPLSLLALQAARTGVILPGDDALELAAVFPLANPDGGLEAMLVWGPAVPTEEYALWQAYLKPISRSIAHVAARRLNVVTRKEFAALAVVASLQNVTDDLNSVQLNALRGMRDIFEAEDALLVLLDDEDPYLAITLQLGHDDSGLSQVSQRVENGLLSQLVHGGMTIGDSDNCDCQDYMRWLESVYGMNIHDVLCAPICPRDKVFGAVILVNPRLKVSEFYRNELMSSMTSALGNAIENTRQTMQLKISNADLEASLWQITNSRNTLRTFFDSIPPSVYIIDHLYNLVAINLSRSSRANLLPKDLVGEKCYEKLYSRTDPCPACRVRETFSSGRITSRTKREWMDQEKAVDWEIMTFPIHDREDAPVPHQVIIFEEDITEKQMLEANLIQSEKLAAVGQLAAGVAHEINNPLAAIIANAQIMRRILPKDDVDLLDSVKLIETAGIRASQVVSNLLGIARKERKQESEAFSINETIRGALSLVQHEVINRSVQVVLDLDDDIPEIIASRNPLQGVWINLIINGIDAIDKSNGQITISSRYNSAEKEFRIGIADNGKGIPQEQLSRIFEPFYTTKSVGKGTGLGLSVCLRVIKEHRGNIQVDSQPGVGTKFTIILPDINRGS